MPPAHDNHTPQMTQAAQQSFGTFSSPAFASIGDPYQKKANPLSRHKGRQFQTNPVKRGQTKEIFLQKEYRPLYNVSLRAMDLDGLRTHAHGCARLSLARFGVVAAPALL